MLDRESFIINVWDQEKLYLCGCDACNDLYSRGK